MIHRHHCRDFAHRVLRRLAPWTLALGAVFLSTAGSWAQSRDRDPRSIPQADAPARGASHSELRIGLRGFEAGRSPGSWVLSLTSGSGLELAAAEVRGFERSDLDGHRWVARVAVTSVVHDPRGRRVTFTSATRRTLSIPEGDVVALPRGEADAGAPRPAPRGARAPAHERLAEEVYAELPRRRPEIAGTRFAGDVSSARAGGRPAVLTVEGKDLAAVAGARVLVRDGRRGWRLDESVRAEWTLPRSGLRRVVLRADPEALPGERRVELLEVGGAAVYVGQFTVESANAGDSGALSGAPPLLSTDRPPIPPGDLRRVEWAPGVAAPTAPPPRTPVVSYDVHESVQAQREELEIQEIQQAFVALSTHVEGIDLHVSGSGPVEVLLVRNQGMVVLASSQAPIAATGPTRITFSPAVATEVGTWHRIYVRRKGASLRAQLSRNPDRYPFSHPFAVPASGGQFQAHPDRDLSMRVHGYYEAMPQAAGATPRPNQKALVVLLENGGAALGQVAELTAALPQITVARCSGRRIELRPGETLVAKIQQIFGLTMHCMNPANWSIESLSFEDWWADISDYLLEEIHKSVAMAVKNTSAHRYDKVVLLEDGDFTVAKVLATLRELAPNYVLDVHVLCHGGHGVFVGHNHEVFTATNFFASLLASRAKGELPMHLRAVYQMNCSSGTVVPLWRGVGAEVVNGTSGAKLNCMPIQYHHFLRRWLDQGQTFSAATSGSYTDALPYFQVIWSHDPVKVTDSRLFTTGNGGLRMTSP